MKNSGLCQHCRKPFETNRLAQRFCSPRCRQAVQRERLFDKRKAYDREWKKRNRDKTASYCRKWWVTRGKVQARVPPSEWYQGPCLGCGETVNAICAGGHNPLYCSNKCRRLCRKQRIGVENWRAEGRRGYRRMKTRRPEYHKLAARRLYERKILAIQDPKLRVMTALLLAFRRKIRTNWDTSEDDLAFVSAFLADAPAPAAPAVGQRTDTPI